MPITLTTSPSEGTLTNTTSVSDAELWSTITTTWASETRTWEVAGSEMTNTDAPKTLGAYTFDEIGTSIIEDTGGAMDDASFMQNTPAPTD